MSSKAGTTYVTPGAYKVSQGVSVCLDDLLVPQMCHGVAQPQSKSVSQQSCCIQGGVCVCICVCMCVYV